LLQITNVVSAPEPFKSLQGQLLLDSGLLSGSFFHRSVVLICQHDPAGAFGLVLNRTTENRLGEMLIEDLPESLADILVQIGGPVQPTALSYLHSDSFLPDANVMANISLGHSLETLIEISESLLPTNKLRVFTGYSGWGAGQLEDEMLRKAWICHAADLNRVFAEEPDDMWREILREKGGLFQLLAQSPDDLSSN